MHYHFCTVAPLAKARRRQKYPRHADEHIARLHADNDEQIECPRHEALDNAWKNFWKQPFQGDQRKQEWQQRHMAAARQPEFRRSLAADVGIEPNVHPQRIELTGKIKQMKSAGTSDANA
jgi:hypothetical protein